MAIPTAYLTVAGNIKPILEDVQKAGVPSKFTYDFLKQLGHPSSANRPVIGVLKAIGFLTDSGTPTDRYRRYKDPRLAGAAMAEGIREGYADVFTVDQEAYLRNTSELMGIFSRLSDKGDAVSRKMATTFKNLAELADFQAPLVPQTPQPAEEVVEVQPAEQATQSSQVAGAFALRWVPVNAWRSSMPRQRMSQGCHGPMSAPTSGARSCSCAKVASASTALTTQTSLGAYPKQPLRDPGMRGHSTWIAPRKPSSAGLLIGSNRCPSEPSTLHHDQTSRWDWRPRGCHLGGGCTTILAHPVRSSA
jgi:Family of unknown function (DUF5343)